MTLRKVALALLMLSAAMAASAQYALPTVSVANLRGKPGHAGELVSQVVTGTPLKLLSRQGSWIYVETPEGYKGYVRSNSLHEIGKQALSAWQNADRVVVTALDRQWITSDPGSDWTKRVSDVLPGAILEVAGTSVNPEYIAVRLPDGRSGFIPAEATVTFEEWTDSARPDAPEKAMGKGYAMMGTPYLWGGTSVLGVDCSGFTQSSLYRYGILLPRDASQQALIGEHIFDRRQGEKLPADLKAKLKPGDLLFFGNAATHKVNHVGFYAGNGDIIHCSGRVKVNSLLPGERADDGLYLLSVRRLTPETIESLSVKSMPIYTGKR